MRPRESRPHRATSGRPDVLPISSDMFFTAADSAAEQELIRGSELRVLETLWGHIGLFGMDPLY